MMACHAARVIRQRHKAEHDMLETDLSPGRKISPGTLITIVVAANGVRDRAPAYDVSSLNFDTRNIQLFLLLSGIRWYDSNGASHDRNA